MTFYIPKQNLKTFLLFDLKLKQNWDCVAEFFSSKENDLIKKRMKKGSHFPKGDEEH
jgi:hypothetical protein